MEANKIKMNIDGTIRAKVLQYKSDGNTLTEKWETLKKYAEGVYYAEATESYSNIPTYRIVFEENGVFWYSGNARPKDLEAPENRAKVAKIRSDFEQNVIESAQNSQYIRFLEIEVMRRLGHDVSPLIASREAYLRHREEEERQKAEDAARREQQRKEAEKRRKAELLADGKEKLLSHKAITVEQIELIAEAVGYTIHGRTLGFMREKVSEAVLNADETVSVWGRKLTSCNINGTADVIRELAERVKAQAEAEAQQPATATETPQISTEAAETVNCTAEGEKAQDTAYMPQFYNCEWQTMEEFKKIPNISKLAKAGIIVNGVGWHTEYLNQSLNVLARVDNLPWNTDRHGFPYQGSGFFGKTELFDNWEDAVIATIDALTKHLQQ